MIFASCGVPLTDDIPNRRFELLAMPHLGATFNLARWLTGNTADAEDVVQDAYLRAFRYVDSVPRRQFPHRLVTVLARSNTEADMTGLCVLCCGC